MKDQITTPSTRAIGIFAVALMAVLILFSSCTGRKSFQAFFEIPVAKPLSLNKATLSNGNICNAAVTESKAVSNIGHPSVDAAIFILYNVLPQLPSFIFGNTIPGLAGCKATDQLPYYILYKQMKVFS